MSYFRTCPDCGAHLDPEEKCDCRKESIDEESVDSEFDKEDESK